MSSYEIPAVARCPASPTRQRLGLSTRWISTLTLLGMLLLWWSVTASEMIEPLFLPSPAAVLQKGWLLATQGYMDATLWQHLAASHSRIGLALLFAVLFAIPVGVAMAAGGIGGGWSPHPSPLPEGEGADHRDPQHRDSLLAPSPSG